MIERADRMTTPIVEGEYYLVPTVRYVWNHMTRNWPVMGPLHNDADRFPFPYDHYHLDVRFLPKRMFADGRRPFSEPLHVYPCDEKLPAPIYRRMRCRRTVVDYPHHGRDPIKGIARDFAELQCAHGKGGWICPHRKFSLGSVEPVDGVVTCPLHGLRIDAQSGRVLSLTTGERDNG